MQIKPHEVSTGVTLEEAKRRARVIFETVVKPQVESERKLTDKEKELKLSNRITTS